MLSQDMCLKYTKAEIELITDIDQYLFIEKSIRGTPLIIYQYKWTKIIHILFNSGGLAIINHKYGVKAENKVIEIPLDEENTFRQESGNTLLYLDYK